jgi:hypothetical protein
MSELDLDDVVRLSSLKLAAAGIVPREERKDSNKDKEEGLKIQLLFYGWRVERAAARIISPSRLSDFHSLLGDKIFIKFKINEEVWKKCLELGIQPNSECEWDAVPQVWNYFDKPNNKTKFGIWYKPARLLRLDGKEVNYQILKPSTRPPLQNAFDLFNFKANESSFNWQNSLSGMENQINSELQEVEQ